MAQGTADASELAKQRARLLSEFEKVLGRYLPESGELKPWKLAEIEAALSEDGHRLLRQLLEARIEVDPLRQVHETIRCPECGHALPGDRDRRTHKKTIFGTIYYTRAYGYCRSCGAAFSPSGERVELRQGLL
jgi:hypothetical protein